MKKFWFFAAAAACVALTCCDKNPGPDDGEFDVLSKISDPGFLAYCQEMMPEDGLVAGTSYSGSERTPMFRVSAWDTDGNGKLSLAEAAAVTHMNPRFPISEGGISSLSGIEYFTGLEFLCCHGLKLTTVDISKNTALTELHFRQCGLLGLDVSKNTALTELYLYDNDLRSLNVTNNTELIWLRCNDNQISSLDLSKNTALTRLYCWGNRLSSLDVTNNAELRYLDCGYNQLTSLDVSKNPELTSLLCYKNKINSLDLSENAVLNLLYCDDNQLTSLDISKNPNIGSCYFDGNPGDGATFPFMHSGEVSKSWEFYGKWTYNGATITVDWQQVD